MASWAPTYWYQGEDHTTADTNGKMALFNATPVITDEFYRTIVQGVIANAPLTYSFWVLNLDRSDAPGIGSRYRPNLTVEFRDLSNNLLNTITTGNIAPTTAGCMNAAETWAACMSEPRSRLKGVVRVRSHIRLATARAAPVAPS